MVIVIGTAARANDAVAVVVQHVVAAAIAAANKTSMYTVWVSSRRGRGVVN